MITGIINLFGFILINTIKILGKSVFFIIGKFKMFFGFVEKDLNKATAIKKFNAKVKKSRLINNEI